MSILFIRLPPRSAGSRTPGQMPQPGALGCTYALATEAGSIEREGVAALADLAPLVGAAQRVVLILAAADVSLLRVALPPLSPARLKAALPNLVEDQLLADPSEVVVAAGRAAEGLRTVAVVQRDWLEMLGRTMLALGARKVAAVPAQLCLPQRDGVVSAVVSEIETGAEREVTLALRLAAEEGMGLSLLAEAGQASAPAALQMLQVVVPEAAVALSVPAAQVAAYQKAVAEAGEPRITVQADRWTHWIAGAQSAEPDLLAALGSQSGPAIHWSRWRGPLVLASAVLLVNIVALNLDWWRLKQEANTARAALTRVFQDAYPAETVIIDPVLQMQQKIAAGKSAAGQPSADDFAPLAAAFAEAWNRAGAGRPLPPIAALEYHERALLVRIKPPGEVPLAQLQPALAARNLTLTPQGADAVQIRSGR